MRRKGSGLVYRGRSIGVRLNVKGHRPWIGSVTRSCPDCEGKPLMCGRCKAEAEVEAFELRDRAKDSKVYKRESCGAFADRWMDDYSEKGTRWDASSKRNYKGALRMFTRRYGSVPMREFDASMARSWTQDSPLYYGRVARAMFADALRDGLIPSNPFQGLRLESSAGRSNLVAITEDELHLLCELALRVHGKHGAKVAAMIAVAGYTAIRPGELYAIEPDRLRPEAQELDVDWQWNGREWKRPKSKKPRTVVLPPETQPFLEPLPSYVGGIQVNRVLPNGSSEPIEVRPVFRTQHGTLYQRSTWVTVWHPIRSAFEAKLSEARVRELRDSRDGKAMDLYELRHYGATDILRRGGTLDDAAHQLGHADTKLVSKVYGHLEESYKLDRIKRLYGSHVRDFRAVDGESEAANG